MRMPFEENQKLVEKRVEFGSIECCAFSTAFAENPHVRNALKNMVGEKMLRLSEDELANTEHLMLMPSDEMKIIYAQLGKAEQQRLHKEGIDFHCRYKHSLEEHQKAIKTVLQKIKIETQ